MVTVRLDKVYIDYIFFKTWGR